eukprot:1330997-Amorphochlora_amoeboformis.AAC.1
MKEKETGRQGEGNSWWRRGKQVVKEKKTGLEAGGIRREGNRSVKEKGTDGHLHIESYCVHPLGCTRNLCPRSHHLQRHRNLEDEGVDVVDRRVVDLGLDLDVDLGVDLDADLGLLLGLDLGLGWG